MKVILKRFDQITVMRREVGEPVPKNGTTVFEMKRHFSFQWIAYFWFFSPRSTP
jgi:hypothetical protein